MANRPVLKNSKNNAMNHHVSALISLVRIPKVQEITTIIMGETPKNATAKNDMPNIKSPNRLSLMYCTVL